MLFGRYAALAEDDVWPIEIAGPLRERLSFSCHALARSLGPDGFEALGEQSVRAFENAEPLPGPFPLIVIGQGLYYESPIAFAALSEYLAGRGFVVATCPLVGTHTQLVKLDIEDLETQVRDLEFVIARALALTSSPPPKAVIRKPEAVTMPQALLKNHRQLNPGQLLHRPPNHQTIAKQPRGTASRYEFCGFQNS